jgi:TonB-linked SusC/RagA family outer membrane protein
MKNIGLVFRRLLFLFIAVSVHGVIVAQTGKTISGVLRDATGESIVGASVAVKGTTVGTSTDIDGAYTLSLPEVPATLVFSYIGMISQEHLVNANTARLDVVLEEEVQLLDELVVIGYGVVKKRDLTGTVSSIKASEIEHVASNNAMEAMQSRIPGMDITKSSGAAGAGLSMKLRGTRSIGASNAPLVLVDGVEYGSTIDINVSDIESMEVLKDASSTAIYGTRGANGVVIITTKRGQAGRTRVNVNAYLSNNMPTHIPEVMTPQDDVRMLIERRRYNDDNVTKQWGSTPFDKYTVSDILTTDIPDGRTLSDLDIYNSGNFVDWIDLVLQNGLTQNYEASVSGGSESTNFNLSLGTMQEEGMLQKDKMGRYNVKVNLDHRINKVIKVGTSILYTYKNWDRRDGRVFNQSLKLHTIAEAYDMNGEVINTPNPNIYAAGYSPLLDDVEGRYEHNIKEKRFFGNVYGEWDMMKGLKFRTMFALDQRGTRDGTYDDYLSMRGQSATGSNMSVTQSDNSSFTWDNTLNYLTTINQEHELNLLLGQSATETIFESHGLSGIGPKEHFSSLFYNMNKATTTTISNEYVKTAMLSYFGRVNYKWKDKYLLTASLRSDGSSVLAEGHKWGYFPSAAVAWRVNEEGFLENVDPLDNLKLRLSWGKSGSSAVEAYQTVTAIGKDPVYYNFAALVTGQVPSILGDENLRWETTATYNVGLDFGFLNRITGTIDAYWAKTNDLLLYKALPPSAVYPQVLTNIGATENRGIEISLNTNIIRAKDWNWDITWSYAANKEKVTALASGVERDVTDIDRALVVGEPISFYDFEYDGIWSIAETDEAARYGAIPGQIKVKDLHEDYDESTGERIYRIDDNDKRLFKKNPDFIFGMNHTVSYGNFTLLATLYSRVGQWMRYDYMDLYKPTVQDASVAADFWTPENQNAVFPRPGIATGNTWSSLQLKKASYLKLKDITLSYDLPKSLLSKANISKVKVYGSLKNFFTFSNIDNYDPERNGAVSFPLSKQVIFGLNLEF